MTEGSKIDIRKLTQIYQPDWRRSLWQLINSVIPYFSILFLMYLSLDYSYWLILLLAIPAAGFLVRIFIIFHDCGHASFFRSNRLNTIVGYFTGILTFVPYHDWRFDHARHHATCSDLDRRGVGDIWTLTVGEYKSLSKWNRFWYRLYRNPMILFGFGSLYLFLVSNRFVKKGSKKRERRSVHWTNLSLLILAILFSYAIGFRELVLLLLPTIFFAGTAGIWLFYVQHQFEDSYWEKHEDWDFYKAALKGSSFYRLPGILQWFTGNIGFHHVHHLNARIPNYFLQSCHEEEAVFNKVKPITIWESFKTVKFRLWDEKGSRMVGFRSYMKLITVKS